MICVLSFFTSFTSISLHSSSDGNIPYEDFHEKYISYKHEIFRIRSVSFEDQTDTEQKAEEVSEKPTRYARCVNVFIHVRLCMSVFYFGFIILCKRFGCLFPYCIFYKQVVK